jgi:hypothetical protein
MCAGKAAAADPARMSLDVNKEIKWTRTENWVRRACGDVRPSRDAGNASNTRNEGTSTSDGLHILCFV